MEPGSNEWLDLVDDQDRVIGKIQRQEAHKLGLTNTRAVHLFIENDQGQLWIPRRSAHKVTYPLGLDFSVSGCVESGETYEQALVREALEEINMKLSIEQCELIGYFKPQEHGVRMFQKVYKLRSNTTPSYNTQDFCESFWLYPDEARTMITNGEKAKADLRNVLRLVLTL